MCRLGWARNLCSLETHERIGLSSPAQAGQENGRPRLQRSASQATETYMKKLFRRLRLGLQIWEEFTEADVMVGLTVSLL